MRSIAITILVGTLALTACSEDGSDDKRTTQTNEPASRPDDFEQEFGDWAITGSAGFCVELRYGDVYRRVDCMRPQGYDAIVIGFTNAADLAQVPCPPETDNVLRARSSDGDDLRLFCLDFDQP